MDTIRLMDPARVRPADVTAFREAFLAHGESVIHGGALLDKLDLEEWLRRRQERTPEQAADWVLSDTFFAVREQDGALVGIIDIRHNLDNVYLATYGGHIGYAVRPDERRKGYGTQMLRLGLAHARSLGLTKVMLSCYTDNLASRALISRCGGRLTVEHALDGRPIQLYLIDIANGAG